MTPKEEKIRNLFIKTCERSIDFVGDSKHVFKRKKKAGERLTRASREWVGVAPLAFQLGFVTLSIRGVILGAKPCQKLDKHSTKATSTLPSIFLLRRARLFENANILLSAPPFFLAMHAGFLLRVCVRVRGMFMTCFGYRQMKN